MTYKIPGTDGLLITASKDIVSADGHSVVARGTAPSVSLQILGKMVVKTTEWIYGISTCGTIDAFDLEHLQFVFNPMSRSTFPWYAWYDKPKTLCNGKYRIVPGYSNLAVTEYGEVVDSATMAPYDYTIAHGYRHVYCRISKYRKELFVPVYKLVALAWLSNKTPIKTYVVDHINGNKLDDRATNLRWVTYKENSDAAVASGLVPQARKGRIRDIFTGEVAEFPSLESMNEFLGLRAKEINHFLTRRRNNVYAKRYEVRIEGDTRPWVYTQECQNVEPSRYIITVIEPTTTKVFNGVRKLISHYGLCDLPVESCSAAVEQLEQDHPDYTVTVIDQYDTRNIEVKDLETGLVAVYSTVRDLVQATGWCKTTVLAAIKHNGRKCINDRYVLRRQSDNPWPMDIRIVRNRPVALEIIDKDTQKAMTCDSIKSAARALKRDREYVTRCIDRPKESDRYVIKLKQLPLHRETEDDKKVNC